MDSPREYTYNKEKKRFVSPVGEELNVKLTLAHLNNLFSALDFIYYRWGELHEVLAAMDSVFLGASQPQGEIDEDAEVEEGEDKELKDLKEQESGEVVSLHDNDTKAVQE